MIKTIVRTLSISLSIAMIILLTLEGRTFTYLSISNAFFMVGVVIFFVYLTSLTRASNILHSSSYFIKALFRKSDAHTMNYSQYKAYHPPKQVDSANQAVKMSIGLVYIIIAFVLTFFV